MKRSPFRVAVVGGGVAGSSVALYLSELGVDVTLFEKSKSLVNGPPICHLHAGGNLYRDISDEQCLTLLKESIELIRLYPQAIDYRPTVIAVPKEDSGSPSDLFSRLELLQKEYKELIAEDENNRVLGDSESYYKLFSYADMLALQGRNEVSSPQTLEEWMIPLSKHLELEKLQYPLVMVQEYGINIFRLGATATLWLEENENATVLTQTEVQSVKREQEKFLIEYSQEGEVKTQEFDYLINAAGFRSGEIDDMLGFKRERLVEFKAAYVTKCEAFKGSWPEVIFHGERGTPNGMAQFTPYPDGYFQLHGMTKNVTLFSDGLVKSSAQSAQPKLPPLFLSKIEKGWSKEAVKERTASAIKHMAQFIPVFSNAKIMSQPLYGAQQIPGEDASLRAADISFEGTHYARCEIVKASSVLKMADSIVKKFIGLGVLSNECYKQRDFSAHSSLKEYDIKRVAESFAKSRAYPKSIANRCFRKSNV